MKPHYIGAFQFKRPTPHGVGGLKFVQVVPQDQQGGPTPHGVGGLKFVVVDLRPEQAGPTPHGVGGLKYQQRQRQQGQRQSHPSRGGWIEIPIPARSAASWSVPPLTGWVD